MTYSKLLDLLIEAREYVEYCSQEVDTWMEPRHPFSAACLFHINKAIAEQQDPVTDDTEWGAIKWRTTITNEWVRCTTPNGFEVKVELTEGVYQWWITKGEGISHQGQYGRCATRDEAKSAAIAAARGLR
jgi:hypothetical protein